jgi:hypothetical protein
MLIRDLYGGNNILNKSKLPLDQLQFMVKCHWNPACIKPRIVHILKNNLRLQRQISFLFEPPTFKAAVDLSLYKDF